MSSRHQVATKSSQKGYQAGVANGALSMIDGSLPTHSHKRMGMTTCPDHLPPQHGHMLFGEPDHGSYSTFHHNHPQIGRVQGGIALFPPDATHWMD